MSDFSLLRHRVATTTDPVLLVDVAELRALLARLDALATVADAARASRAAERAREDAGIASMTASSATNFEAECDRLERAQDARTLARDTLDATLATLEGP